MNLTVLFFGATADATGLRKVELEAHPEETVGSLLDELLKKYRKLSNHTLVVAVNEEYAETSTLLNNADRVAIFTAVSGG
jgi:sulfur-carrier protein